MIHPDTEVRYISEKIGKGVIARKFIPRGTIVWVQDKLDRIFQEHEIISLPQYERQMLETYCFINHKGQKILCWDNGKYVNHSFKPSCFSTAYNFEIAIRDIHPGEELTDDYGYLNVERPFEGIDEGTERKIVYPDDLLTYHAVWDKMVASCLPDIFSVDQPLLSLIPIDIWEEFQLLEKYPEKMRSLLECYYQPQMVK